MSNFIDIIIPVRNEEENVTPLVERIHSSLGNQKISYSLVFIDDHSTDNTVKILKKLSKKYPISVHMKMGKGGKAFSILEGVKHTKSTFIGMIDADLQYPPEVIPEMLSLTEKFGVVVARRDSTKDSKFRRFISKGFQYVFGKLLFNLDCDVQSGLKVFHREIIENVRSEDVSAWTLDVPLLTTALEMGESIGEVSITFDERKHGASKIKLVQSIKEIGGQAIIHKFKGKKPILVKTTEPNQMVGAGMYHKGQKFITHTNLDTNISALITFSRKQKIFFGILILTILVGVLLNFVETLMIVVALLSFIYFVDVVFNMILIIKSLKSPPEISFSDQQLRKLKDKELPIYSVLCPLYKEAHILPTFVDEISKMDWPKDKLDVLLLLEEDDEETIVSAKQMKLPSYVRVVIVPNSQPKTKPKACNYGLHMAKGEYIVIYDAEDIPDPQQLKKAYLAFTTGDQSIRCYQAKLNYHNPHQNLLTRFFTAEYSLWFDVILTGLQTIQTTIPLGGTSNHFRKSDLLTLRGWDPFNVTEDCDLGVRLFKNGWKTAIIDSVTLEEANSNWHNWLRQRSRWIKGYMQTYLIHMRHPGEFLRKQGIHALLFQLTIGGKIAFMIINPIMWLLTISYFTLYQFVGPTIESFYPSIVFYMAVTSLIFGNFMFIYYYMIGAAKREHWTLIKWVYLVPFYWLMVSVAAVIALYQLIVKPHYWEKTVHGLHLKKKKLEEEAEKVTKEAVAQIVAQAEDAPNSQPQISFSFRPQLYKNIYKVKERFDRFSLRQTLLVLKKPLYSGGILFLIASMVGNVINMLTNIILGHQLSFEHFGIFNIVVSLLYLSSIPINALSSTINYQTGYLTGKHSLSSVQHFWRYIRKRAFFVAIIITGLWLILTPFLPGFFNLDSILPFIAFSVIWGAGILSAVDLGYLSGRLLFAHVAILLISQPLIRIIFAIGLSFLAPEHSYIAIVAGVISTAFITSYLAKKGDDEFQHTEEFHLPRSFFLISLLSGFSSIAFFSLDTLIVAHLMSTVETGQYGVIGLFGKMIYFVGNLTSAFLAPMVARFEGAGKNSRKIFHFTLVSVVLMSSASYLVFGLGMSVVGPQFLGEKIQAIHHLLPIYGLGVALFTLAQVFVSYHLVKKDYLFPIIGVLLSGIQILAMWLFHDDLLQITLVMTIIGAIHLMSMILLHTFYPRIQIILSNMQDFADLFSHLPFRKGKTHPIKRILIFNWRDTRHLWAGGAEVYIHEIAKRLVAQGYKVTVFCGNDGKSPRNQVIDGVQIIRRGGFYTVYVWAALYYLLRLRHYVDIVIDSENGIPFLTPLYVRKPIILLIHHIHQEVFRNHLNFPLAQIAQFIEGQLMPFFYSHAQVITVSNSSKKAITKLGLGSESSISVINPGIDLTLFSTMKKTTHPSLVYVGRLKPYKQLDVALKAFATIVKSYPKAKFTIAGFGESLSDLKRLAKQLEIQDAVSFLPRVTDEDKVKLFAESWVAIQPSLIEGWGITVIEANSCGTPVIASNVAGLRDSVVDNETGVLVRAGHIDGFSIAISELFDNKKKRTQFSKNAQKWSEKFDWEGSVGILISLIEQKQAQYQLKPAIIEERSGEK